MVDQYSSSSTETIALRQGEFSAELRHGDLFDVRWCGIEVAQRIYVAVRDEYWNTIPAVIGDLEIQERDTDTEVHFKARHAFGDMDFEWRGMVSISRNGELAFAMHGVAHSAFKYCKIGFNIHHGLREHRGRTFRCFTDGGLVEGIFENDLQPQLISNGTLTAMTPHFDALEIDLADLELRYEFLGDRFEMQDHRNWIDANWKTYGTPLEFGFPMDIQDGGELFQEVRLIVRGHPARSRGSVPVRIEWGNAEFGRLPELGHLIRQEPDRRQLTVLRRLKPRHIRVDLHPASGRAEVPRQFLSIAEELGAGLEVGAFIREEECDLDTQVAADALMACDVPIVRILALAESSGFSAFRGACPPYVAEALRDALPVPLREEARIVSGTTQFFSDLNRDRPDYSGVDGLVFAVNPQVHAADDVSMMQNLEAIPDVVGFARTVFGNVDVCFSPVDLIGFDGPFPAGPQGFGAGVANEDSRQRVDYCAAWTLAAVAAASECGVTAMTLFELVGPRGLMEDPSQPFPVFDIVAGLESRSANPVRRSRSSHPEQVVALEFDGGGKREVFIGNLTTQRLGVELPDGRDLEVGPYQVRIETVA